MEINEIIARKSYIVGTQECINTTATTTIAIKMVKNTNKTQAIAQHI